MSYTTPVSVDHFGSYPGKKPGDMFEIMYEGGVWRITIMPGKAIHQPNGTILRMAHCERLEGPVNRNFMPFTLLKPGAYYGRKKK